MTRNRERDQEVWRKLEAKGWNVIIVRECELKKGGIEETVERVVGEIVKNGEAYCAEQEKRRRDREVYRLERRSRRERERALLEEVRDC